MTWHSWITSNPMRFRVVARIVDYFAGIEIYSEIFYESGRSQADFNDASTQPDFEAVRWDNTKSMASSHMLNERGTEKQPDPQQKVFN